MKKYETLTDAPSSASLALNANRSSKPTSLVIETKSWPRIISLISQMISMMMTSNRANQDDL